MTCANTASYLFAFPSPHEACPVLPEAAWSPCCGCVWLGTKPRRGMTKADVDERLPLDRGDREETPEWKYAPGG